MNFNDLLRRRCAWLRDDGPDSDVAISSRVRLARNLSGFSFVGRASDGDLRSVVDACSRVAEKKFSRDDAEFIDCADISTDDARFLQERLLVSREFAEAAGKPRALLLEKRENFCAMINEEDHLRLQATARALEESRRTGRRVRVGTRLRVRRKIGIFNRLSVERWNRYPRERYVALAGVD